METRIESQFGKWKSHSTKNRKYVLGRSCVYESSPPEGNLLPRLTVRIFVHGAVETKIKVGEISISVDRDRWKVIAGLNNASEADNQLRTAANSAIEGNWNVDPLPNLLRKACQVISGEIARYESADQLISGGFPM